MSFTFSSSVRLAQVVCLGSIALLAFLVSFGNIFDYYSNFHFVEHVMKMDTVFPESTIRKRSIESQAIYHFSYVLLIAAELVMGILCMTGVIKMIRRFNQVAEVFEDSKKWGVAGITIGILIWFFGFQVVGGEWFGMWQSETWNGLYSADRILTFIVLTLLLLVQRR